MNPKTVETLNLMEQAIPPDVIMTKVVGVTAGEITNDPDNPDKEMPSLQLFIRTLSQLNIKSVDLVPEPDNPYDENAIAVYVSSPIRKRIGYISNKQRICTACAATYDSAPDDVCQRCGGKLIRIGQATQLSMWYKKSVRYAAEIAKYLGGQELNYGVLLRLKRIQ